MLPIQDYHRLLLQQIFNEPIIERFFAVIELYAAGEEMDVGVL